MSALVCWPGVVCGREAPGQDGQPDIAAPVVVVQNIPPTASSAEGVPQPTAPDVGTRQVGLVSRVPSPTPHTPGTTVAPDQSPTLVPVPVRSAAVHTQI